jgi:hypothetical protein
MKPKKYEKSILKGLPSVTHKAVKRALRSQSKSTTPKTGRQNRLSTKLSAMRFRQQEDDIEDYPLRGSRRGAESPTDK